MKETLVLDRKTVNIFVPDSGQENVKRVIYLNGGYEDADEIWRQFTAGTAEDGKAAGSAGASQTAGTALVAIDITREWNSALTPWEAPRTFKGGEDFAGKADEYLRILTGIVFLAEDEIARMTGAGAALNIQSRAIAGYSLAGLFAVWSFYKTNMFDRLASMSGSLWFDGFADFMKENKLVRIPDKAYFSLGDKEKKTRNQRMAAVEDCTALAAELFKTAGAETIIELAAGGHFDDETERIVKGLRFIAD